MPRPRPAKLSALRISRAKMSALESPDPAPRAAAMRRWCFTVLVKPDKLAAYKKHHDEIWPEVAGGLRRAGLRALTTWQLPGTNRLVMYIETSGVGSLDAAVGAGSEYRRGPRTAEWEDLMCSFFEGGDWTLMSEIHASDCEWNASLGLAQGPGIPPAASGDAGANTALTYAGVALSAFALGWFAARQAK